jgi:hypothetical protein
MEPADHRSARACERLAVGQSDGRSAGRTVSRTAVPADTWRPCLLLSLCIGAMERFSAFYTGTGAAAQRLPVSGRPTACGTPAPPPRRSLRDTGSRSRCSPSRLSGGCIVRLNAGQPERVAAGTGGNLPPGAASSPTSAPSVRHTIQQVLHRSVETAARVATDSPDRRTRRASECRNGCPTAR